jgi:hypothetical protein
MTTKEIYVNAYELESKKIDLDSVLAELCTCALVESIEDVACITLTGNPHDIEKEIEALRCRVPILTIR